MKRRSFTVGVLASGVAVLTALPGMSPLAMAAEPVIYGSQLMTKQERLDYRAKLRSAKTVEERAQIRAEHHKAMQERAKARGVKLPDAPPARPMHQGKQPGANRGQGGMGGGQGGNGPGNGQGMMRQQQQP